MPNLDILTIVKWLVILAVAVGVIGFVVSTFAPIAKTGQESSAYFDEPVSGGARMGYVEGSGNPHKPSIERVGVLMLDALLGEGVWTQVASWVAGGVVSVIIMFIVYGVWKAVTS